MFKPSVYEQGSPCQEISRWIWIFLAAAWKTHWQREPKGADFRAFFSQDFRMRAPGQLLMEL
tara:strand:- start:331 stop:516 length:186 start_codon:yes stop_codon:yes gene_type:complete